MRAGRIPIEAETYEYASPPAFHWLAVQAQGLVDAVGADARSAISATESPFVRLGWVVLLVAGVALVVSAAPISFRLAGALLLVATVLAAVLHVLAVAAATPWLIGQALSALALVGFLLVSWLLARAVWPGSRLLPLAVLAATAALPIVLRLGTMFHPELLFALLVATAVLLFLRARASSWSPAWGIALGAVLGLAALTRQTAAIVIVALGVSALLLGRRRALVFAAATAVMLLIVAGPWWLHQLDRYGNPIQSNLEREGYLLSEGQPRSFYISLPLPELVTHPYRPAFQNELLPKFHADLWSDWFGAQHGYWGSPTTAGRFFASTQSVLGLAGSALGPIALLLLAAPALSGRAHDGRSAAFATFAILTVLTWIAFVVTLVRYPQAEGDPIKSSYMLFLAPVFALAGTAFAERVWRRHRAVPVAIAAWAILYALSYAGFVATSF